MADRCSFCGVAPTPARGLVHGPDDAAVCRDCAELAVSLLDERSGDSTGDMVMTGISTVVTMDPRRGGQGGHPLLGIQHDVVMAVRRGKVVWLGDEPQLPGAYRDLPVLDCEGRVVIPGMVDAAAPLLGDPPVERPDPVEATELLADRLRRTLTRGVTAVDLRVGGGVEPTVETLLLAVARAAGDRMPGMHAVSWRCSPGFAPRVLSEVMAPTVARLAGFAVVECNGDPSGLARTVDSLGPLRARLRCHEPEPDACLDLMHRFATVEASGNCAFGPDGPVPVLPWWEAARALTTWRAGTRPALATFSDPDATLLEGMGFVLRSAVEAGLDLGEALWSVTRGGAAAVGDGERGWVHLGGPADLVVLDGDDPSELVRRPDAVVAWRVVAGGLEVG